MVHNNYLNTHVPQASHEWHGAAAAWGRTDQLARVAEKLPTVMTDEQQTVLRGLEAVLDLLPPAEK